MSVIVKVMFGSPLCVVVSSSLCSILEHNYNPKRVCYRLKLKSRTSSLIVLLNIIDIISNSACYQNIR